MISRKYKSQLSDWMKSDFSLNRLRISDHDHVRYRYIAQYIHPDFGKICGYGESNWKSKALIIAINELLEREACILHGKELGAISTNGFASHDSVDQAKMKARLELTERDSFLRHWLLKEPMIALGNGGLDTWRIRRSLKKIHHSLEIYKTYLGEQSTFVAVITNDQNPGCVVGTSISRSQSASIRKAAAEAFYTLHIVRLSPVENWEGEANLLNHSRYWYSRELPQWWSGPCDKSKSRARFNVEYKIIKTDPTVVVKAYAKDALELWINKPSKKHLAKIRKDYQNCSELNIQPHPLA